MTHWWQERGRITDPPNEVVTFLLTACVISGAVVIIDGTPPTSIDATLPIWLRYGWALCLLVGGLLGIAGEYWPGAPFTGGTVKVSGLLSAGFACLAYGNALIAVNGWPVARGAAMLNLFFGVACLARSGRLSLRLLQIHRRARVLEDGRGDRP